jgi:hypothetical protein
MDYLIGIRLVLPRVVDMTGLLSSLDWLVACWLSMDDMRLCRIKGNERTMGKN